MVDWLDTGGDTPKEAPGGAPKWVFALALLLLVLFVVIVVTR